MKKNISVVMPVYNAENTIAECIKSVLRSLQDSDELIIPLIYVRIMLIAIITLFTYINQIKEPFLQD